MGARARATFCFFLGIIGLFFSFLFYFLLNDNHDYIFSFRKRKADTTTLIETNFHLFHCALLGF